MKKAPTRAKHKHHPPVPPPKLIKPKKVHWRPPKMAEKKTTHKANDDNDETKDELPESEKPLHAAAPETVDTAKEQEEFDKLQKAQADLLKKQDEERRERQSAENREHQDKLDKKGADRFKE